MDARGDLDVVADARQGLPSVARAIFGSIELGYGNGTRPVDPLVDRQQIWRRLTHASSLHEPNPDRTTLHCSTRTDITWFCRAFAHRGNGYCYFELDRCELDRSSYDALHCMQTQGVSIVAGAFLEIVAHRDPDWQSNKVLAANPRHVSHPDRQTSAMMAIVLQVMNFWQTRESTVITITPCPNDGSIK